MCKLTLLFRELCTRLTFFLRENINTSTHRIVQLTQYRITTVKHNGNLYAPKYAYESPADSEKWDVVCHDKSIFLFKLAAHNGRFTRTYDVYVEMAETLRTLKPIEYAK